jgi:hypothetical protein
VFYFFLISRLYAVLSFNKPVKFDLFLKFAKRLTEESAGDNEHGQWYAQLNQPDRDSERTGRASEFERIGHKIVSHFYQKKAESGGNE